MLIEEDLKKAVVRIDSECVGTGFFVGGDGTLLTCFHVVRDKKTGGLTTKGIRVTFRDQTYSAECIFSPPDPAALDIAVLRLTIKSLPSDACLLPLRRPTSTLNLSGRYCTFGYRDPSHFQGLYTTGRIHGLTETDQGVEVLQLASEAVGAEGIRPGMSGAPVYSDDAKGVIGVVALRSTSQAENIPFAIPLDMVERLWPPLGIRLDVEDTLQGLVDIFRKDEWFTKKTFQALYNSLPFPNLPSYQNSEETAAQELVNHLRQGDHQQIHRFITLLHSQRPDIPLSKLRPFHRIIFVNREIELEAELEPYPAPYILFEAPSGYGKTELLHEIEQRYFRNGWICIFVSTPKNLKTAIDLAALIVQEAGWDAKSLEGSNITDYATFLFGCLNPRTGIPRPVGLLLVIDGIELLPLDQIENFVHFLTKLQHLSRLTMHLRVRLAGRYVGTSWNSAATHQGLVLRIRRLSPFTYRYVRDTLHRMYPDQSNLDLRAAHLMHLTGGHPGGMAAIIERIDFQESLSDAIIDHQDECCEIICEYGEDVRQSIPAHLRDIFDVLSVFRRYSRRLLQRLIDKRIINYSGDAYGLERELMKTYLVFRNDGFIRDDIVRRVLAIRMHRVDRGRFLNLCRTGVLLYEEELKTASSRLEMIAIEVLYQVALLGFYSSDQKSDGRKLVAKQILGENGTLQQCLQILRARGVDEIDQDFLSCLQDDNNNWEFRFTINFFLRDTLYNDEPMRKLQNQAEAFFGGV